MPRILKNLVVVGLFVCVFSAFRNDTLAMKGNNLCANTDTTDPNQDDSFVCCNDKMGDRVILDDINSLVPKKGVITPTMQLLIKNFVSGRDVE